MYVRTAERREREGETGDGDDDEAINRREGKMRRKASEKRAGGRGKAMQL